MAKTQDLPLNPTKISGLCNRLLCCLTYEYDSYRATKKEMPKVGKTLLLEGEIYRVVRVMTLQRTIVVISKDGREVILDEEQWKKAEPVNKGPGKEQESPQ